MVKLGIGRYRQVGCCDQQRKLGVVIKLSVMIKTESWALWSKLRSERCGRWALG